MTKRLLIISSLLIFSSITGTVQDVSSATLSNRTRLPYVPDISFDDEEDKIADAGLKSAEQNLNSSQGYDVLNGISYFDSNFTRLVKDGLVKESHIKILMNGLISPSVNIKGSSKAFFDRHLKAIFENKIMAPTAVSNMAKDVYNNEKEYMIFLSMIQSMLKNKIYDHDSLSGEFNFNVIDGLDNKNAEISNLSTDILSKHGPQLANKDLLKGSHVTRFVSLTRNLPKKNRSDYLRVFTNNFNTWASKDMLGRRDVQTMLLFMTQFSGDQMADLMAFLKRPQTMANMAKLGVFNREWVVGLKNDIVNGNGQARQNSLNLLSHYFSMFAKNGAITRKEFNEMWALVRKNINSFEDPFIFMRKNHRSLDKRGWYGRNHYEKILMGFDNMSLKEQAQTIDLFDNLYDWLRLREWLGMKRLTKAITHPSPKGSLKLRKLDQAPFSKTFLSDSDHKSLELKKIQFVENHMTSILENNVFTKADVSNFLKKLEYNDPDLYQPAVKVTNEGFSSWAENKVLDTQDIKAIFDKSNINATKSAHLIAIINNNFQETVHLHDKDLIETYSHFLNSGQPDVHDAALTFFENHIDLLEKKHLVSSDTKEKLKTAGFRTNSTSPKYNSSKYRKTRSGRKGQRTTYKDTGDDEELIGD